MGGLGQTSLLAVSLNNLIRGAASPADEGEGGPQLPAPLLCQRAGRQEILPSGEAVGGAVGQEQRGQQPQLPGGVVGAGGGGEGEGERGRVEVGRNGGTDGRGGAVVSPAGLRGPLPGLLPLVGAERGHGGEAGPKFCIFNKLLKGYVSMLCYDMKGYG